MHEHYEPAEVYALLRAHHAPGLSEEQQFALAGRATGMSYLEIGERLVADERTARRMIDEIGRSVSLGCGIAGTNPFVIGFWLAVHADCEHRCTARAIAILRGEARAPGAQA